MGWLRLVGSFKLYVSVAEYSLFYKALLHKRPIILWSLLIVATPYEHQVSLIFKEVSFFAGKFVCFGWKVGLFLMVENRSVFPRRTGSTWTKVYCGRLFWMESSFLLDGK